MHLKNKVLILNAREWFIHCFLLKEMAVWCFRKYNYLRYFINKIITWVILIMFWLSYSQWHLGKMSSETDRLTSRLWMEQFKCCPTPRWWVWISKDWHLSIQIPCPFPDLEKNNHARKWQQNFDNTYKLSKL